MKTFIIYLVLSHHFAEPLDGGRQITKSLATIASSHYQDGEVWVLHHAT